jgi:hypothetical protein
MYRAAVLSALPGLGVCCWGSRGCALASLALAPWLPYRSAFGAPVSGGAHDPESQTTKPATVRNNKSALAQQQTGECPKQQTDDCPKQQIGACPTTNLRLPKQQTWRPSKTTNLRLPKQQTGARPNNKLSDCPKQQKRPEGRSPLCLPAAAPTVRFSRIPKVKI